MLVEALSQQLAEIASLIDAGELRVFIAQALPLSDARKAYARAVRGQMRGKIALQVVQAPIEETPATMETAE